MGKSLGMRATEVLNNFDTGKMSAEEYAHDIIAQNTACKKLNAIASFDADYLVDAAKKSDQKRLDGNAGKLCGLPLVLKDNINTTAFPTTAGTGALRQFTPEHNAGVVADLLGEDAIVGAKSGMHELAFGITSNNAITGAIHNPHDFNKISGGSSGGTAAAVAAGIFPAGLGTDTGGSCRIPAALCGVVGFRPTTGRYASDGIVPISHTRDTIGAIAHTVEDVALLDGVLSGQNGSLSTINLRDIRLGVPKEVFFENLESEVETAIQQQLRVLEAAGVTLIDVEFTEIWPHNEAFGFPVVFYEVMQELPAYLKKYAPEISFEELVEKIGSPDVADAIASQLGADAMPVEAYHAAMNVHRPAMRKIYEGVFKDNQLSAIVFPTTPLRARDIGQDEAVELNGQQLPTFPTYIRNTDLGSNVGVPGISLPCQNISGLPVGIEFDGIAGRDADLIAMAIIVEATLST